MSRIDPEQKFLKTTEAQAYALYLLLLYLKKQKQS